MWTGTSLEALTFAPPVDQKVLSSASDATTPPYQQTEKPKLYNDHTCIPQCTVFLVESHQNKQHNNN
jgi:hypothetical protein